MPALSSADAPEEQKKRAVVGAASRAKKRRGALKKLRQSTSPAKCCKMLKEGKAQGSALSKKQKRLFGACCSERGK